MKAVKVCIICLVLLYIVSTVDAAVSCGPLDAAVEMQFTDTMNALKTVSASLGVLLMFIMSAKWAASMDPGERENAKRGMMYVAFGIALVVSAADLVVYLLC